MSNAAALRTSSIPVQSTPAPSSARAVLLAAGLVPMAPRVPSDIGVLCSVDPMSATLATLRGGESRVRAATIRALILDALAGRE